MKKILISFFIVLMLLSPFSVSATTQEEIKSQLISMLQQVISMLQQQIVDILAQQSIINNSIQSLSYTEPITGNVSQETTLIIPEVVKGCTDNTALNYNQQAQESDGSCKYSTLTITTENDKDLYKITASGEDFIFQDIVINLLNPETQKEQMTMWKVNCSNNDCNKELGSAQNWACYYYGKVSNVPEECSGHQEEQYFFSSNIFNNQETSYQFLINDGSSLMIGAKNYKMVDNFDFISATFKGKTTGKIVKLSL